MAEILHINQEYSIENATGDTIKFSDAIEYVKYRRRVEHYTEPVIFASAYPIDFYLERPNFKILRAIAHDFIRLPYSETDIQSITNHLNPLNEIQLQDIIINYCQLRSAVREGFHSFKGKLREIMGKSIPDAQKSNLFIAEFTKYRQELLKEVGEYPDIITEFNRIISRYNPENISSIDTIQSIQEESFVCFLPDDENGPDTKERVNSSWKVLFLDDKPDELQDIFATLQSRGIDYEIANDCPSAREFITGDIYNKITVVVSDYRLFENRETEQDIPRMQPEQGYDFLFWLSKENRYNALVALSGLSKWFLQESFRKHSINVKVYSKNGLLGGGTKLFVDDLEYLGDQYDEVVNNQPSATLWYEPQYKDKSNTEIKSHPLKPYYVYHRNSNDYISNEEKMNRLAEQVAREAEFALDKCSNFNLGATLSIHGEITTTMKGNPEKEDAVFMKKMLQRRIFFYLQIKGFDKDAIAKLLHTGDMRSEVSPAMIKAVMNMLAIQSNSDVPHHLLVEERFFLQNVMNIPIYQLSELTNQVHVIVNLIVSQYLNFNPKAQEYLKNYCLSDEETDEIVAESVSIFDAHVLIRKVVKALIVIKKNRVAGELLETLIEIFENIKRTAPEIKSLQKNISKLSELKQKAMEGIWE